LFCFLSRNIPKLNAGVVVVAAAAEGWLLPNENGDTEVAGALTGNELPNGAVWKKV
jgi:hypothetical protein